MWRNDLRRASRNNAGGVRRNRDEFKLGFDILDAVLHHLCVARDSSAKVSAETSIAGVAVVCRELFVHHGIHGAHIIHVLDVVRVSPRALNRADGQLGAFRDVGAVVHDSSGAARRALHLFSFPPVEVMPVGVTDVHVSVCTLATDGAIGAVFRRTEVVDFRRVVTVFFALATRYTTSPISIAGNVMETAPVVNVRADLLW